MGQPNVKARMQALLDEIDYDFSCFTLNDFARWLEQRRERSIIFVPREMPAALFGAWVKGINKDLATIHFERMVDQHAQIR